MIGAVDAKDAASGNSVAYFVGIIGEVGEKASALQIRRAHAGQCRALAADGRKICGHANYGGRDTLGAKVFPEGYAFAEKAYTSRRKRK